MLIHRVKEDNLKRLRRVGFQLYILEKAKLETGEKDLWLPWARKSGGRVDSVKPIVFRGQNCSV